MKMRRLSAFLAAVASVLASASWLPAMAQTIQPQAWSQFLASAPPVSPLDAYLMPFVLPGGSGVITGRATVGQLGPYIINTYGTALQPRALSNGYLWVGNQSNLAAAVPMSGDCSILYTGATTCLKTNGVPFGTAATVNTGTSGPTVPFNNGNNTSSGNQTHSGTETFTGTVNLSASSFTPITNASYARALSSLATDNYDVKDWGDAGTCSSDADDTAAFNAASAAVSTAIGGNGRVGVITYSGSCHVCGMVVKRNTIFKNNGGVITVKTGCSATVPIASENYSTLENTAAECGINVNVPSWFGFWDADIDCNSSGGSYSGVCVGTYGPAQLWVGTNTIRNGKNSPMLRTEDSVNGNSQNNPQCQEEGFFDAMIIRDSAGQGWDFRGPHDSVINSITGAWNADYSFYQESSANYNGAIDHLGSIHTYAEANGKGIYLATHLKADSVMVDGDEADIPSSDVHITQMTVYNCGAANDSSCLNVSGNLVTIDALLGTYVTGATGATMVDWTGSQGVISAAQYQGLNNASDFGLVVTGSNNQFTNQIGSGFGGTSSAAFSLAGHDNVLVAQGFGNKTNLAYTGSTKNSVTLKLFTTSGQTGISGTPDASDQFNVMIDGTTVSNYVKFPGAVQTPLLQASSATTFQGQFTSTGSNQASVQINNTAGGQGAFLQYFDAGVSKWIVGQNSSNQYTIFDQINSANAYTIATTGNTTVGEAGKTVTLIGNSSSTGTFTATEVLGTSPTALQGNFISTGSNQATVQINDLAGSQGALLVYLDAGTIKWQLGQNTTNQFTLFDQANSLNAWTVATTGNTTLGETGKTVTINGNTTVSGGSLTVAGVLSTTATALQGNFGSTGANQATVEINNAAGGQGSFLGLYDAGTQKWLAGNNASNSFVVFDQVNSANAVQVTTGGVMTLGESAKTMTLQGTAVGVTSLTASLPVYTDASKNLTSTAPTQTANTVYAGPTTGAAASPTFRALVGADLPNPSASTLGGVESLAAVTHNFLTSISTSGVPAQAQPSAADLSNGVTGSGATVLATSPALTTPNIGAATDTAIISGATKFTISGCSASTTIGGASAGKFSSGTTGTCTVTITINGATGLTVPNGYSCWANDETTPADVIHETGSTATTVTLSGTTVSADVIDFGCMAF